jgi:hypothetical protein
LLIVRHRNGVTNGIPMHRPDSPLKPVSLFHKSVPSFVSKHQSDR